jgi:hypothetical protein
MRLARFPRTRLAYPHAAGVQGPASHASHLEEHLE